MSVSSDIERDSLLSHFLCLINLILIKKYTDIIEIFWSKILKCGKALKPHDFKGLKSKAFTVMRF